MSEQTDIDAKNLCITEEVFEKFQAESMYEEEELITLSDILPPNGTATASAPDDVNDLLADESAQLCGIEIVNSGKITSENVQHSEITTGISEESLNRKQPLLQESDLNVSENVEVHTEIGEEKQPKRKGRQRKKPTQDSPLANSNKIQPEQSQPKRRGRRRKVDNDTVNDLSIEDQMKLIHEENPDISNNKSFLEEQAVEVNTTTQIPKRRGCRKKKVVQEPNVDTSIENTRDKVGALREQLEANVSNQNDPDLPNILPLKRRGRKKKTVQNSGIDTSHEDSHLNTSGAFKLQDEMDQNDDLPISQIKDKNNTSKLQNTHKDLSPVSSKIRSHRGSNKVISNDETDNEKQNVSLGKKRGRPRKQGLHCESQVSQFNNTNDTSIKDEEPSSTVDKPDSVVESIITHDINNSTITNEFDNDDDADNICLSNLKQVLVSENSDNLNKEDIITSTIELDEEKKKDKSPNKRNSKAPVLPDFEYNLDNITNEDTDKAKDNADAEIKKAEGDFEDLLVEDTSRRPKRRKTKQNFHYQEDSDEDPFANVELSDDEPKRGKRGTKFYSDDEYIPGKGKKRGKSYTTESSQSSDIEEINKNLEGLTKQKRKRFSKKMDSPRKKGKITENELALSTLDVTSVPPTLTNNNDDIEVCLESSIINRSCVNPQIDNSSENKSTTWGHTNEFENFIAQIQGTDLKIKKVSSTASTTTIAPLDIPILDQNAKKMTDKSAQTLTAHRNAQGSQTSPPYDIPMKDNVPLTKDQSEKACNFLNSIVKTTSELGVLMTQKSEDFMKKKIHTAHVTDTFKMDYCVRKSFLLFKLAKHNLMQMEDELAKQYDEFLRTNNLHTHREQIKTIDSTSAKKDEETDSDCEIVDVKPLPAQSKAMATKNDKPKFNPKTVFLNKELSIKIAKKTPEDKTPNIKGRHTVWINDSVILKKVTPTQSFLAQDSRNKKPPDHSKTIEKIVHYFFREYDRQRAVSVCAPFISAGWIANRTEYACNYFVAISEIPTGSDHFINSPESSDSVIENKPNSEDNCKPVTSVSSPKSLLSLCTLCIQKQTYNGKLTNLETNKILFNSPHALLELCLHSLNKNDKQLAPSRALKFNNAISLSTICYKKVLELMYITTNQNNLIKHMPEDTFECVEEITQIMLKGEKSIERGQVNNGVKNLFSICVKFIQDRQKRITQNDSLNLSNIIDHETIMSQDHTASVSDIQEYDKVNAEEISDSDMTFHVITPQSLKTITYCKILHLMYSRNSNSKECSEKSASLYEVKTLSRISLDKIKENLFGINVVKPIDMTIKSVNTLSDEAFFNIDGTCTIESNQYQYFEEDSNQYEDDFEPEYELEEAEETAHQDNNWVTQVQMKEFKSCAMPNLSTAVTDSSPHDPSDSQKDTSSKLPFMVNIKSEPLEEELVPQENLIDPAINVKTEPTQEYNEFTISLEDVTTKTEPDSNDPINSVQRKNSVVCDGDAFEAFASSNKMLIATAMSSEEIFSQSALRIRRQFDPDSDDENDAGMSLLIPHTYEPLQITEAKDNLMQSSSDESNKDASSKKKTDKRKKRSKKVEPKAMNKEVNIPSKNKFNKIETVNNEPNTASKNKASRTDIVTNEVAMLTRRMRERIRQEEKKVQSSDSEDETSETRLKIDKNKSKTEEVPDTSQKSQKKKYNDTDIQCNNVDSTEQGDLLSENTSKEKDSIPDEIFTGFSTVDQNEITTYQKYLKDVYDKILPKINEPNNSMNREPADSEQIMNADEPIEYLECEPTLPIFEKEPRKRTSRKSKTVPGKPESKTVIQDKQNLESQSLEKIPADQASGAGSLPYVERHGWQCYPIDVNDKKLYDNCHIPLDKLPETFVEMYFQYQNITERTKEDEVVERLTNLQSLHSRTSSAKEMTSKTKVNKVKTEQGSGVRVKLENDLEGSRPNSPGSDHYNELTPSEDEGSDREEETVPPVGKPPSENNMAKSSLMDDNSDSDTENAEGKKKIKQELDDEASSEKITEAPKRRPGPKSKTRPLVPAKPGEHPDIMLTAEKMMNKELNMLHGPVNIDGKVSEVPSKKPLTRGGKQKRESSKKQIHYRIKNDDDSSSEEEKQWVTTKEKLLKRLEKKQDTTIADEAKRTKIVSEYIERRIDAEPRLTSRRRGRRSNKKFLERQKQLRVLTRELLGDAADSQHQTKRYNQAFFKGRRNIRKVIDKKSLAKGTVMANMEEFERKRRLNMKQSKLREILGCEEGVNVLVINDELCLEYDFEQQQPVVSVHPFFTKIMKAHQYEGVKFMWDACFESLSQLSAGYPGGGCILAHCMGLGKTLQVLALLHTVLTHPGTNMQRVLVCCPLSTVLNWVDEIHKWIGPVTDQIKVFELSKLKKTYERAYQLEDWYSGGGIFIIGYELFRSLTTLDSYLDDVRPTILKKIRTALLDPGPDIIVCDEGHLLKNDCSVLAVAMSRVVTRRRIVLTGTPMQNNLREYYCMVNFVKPNLLGTYSEFSNRFENPIMNGQHRDSSAEDIKLMKARTHILHKVLEGCLQRQEASVLYPYLPKKHEYTVFISLTKCQWDMYKYYLTHYANKAKNGVLKDFHILQKIWSHPQVLHHFQTKARDGNTPKVKGEKIEDDLAEEEAATEDVKPSDTDIWWLQFLQGGAMLDSLESSNKFVVVFRILDECIKLGDKVLIFSTSLFTMDALEFFLRKINKWSLGQEYYRLDGSVPAEVRQKWCREFNAEHNLKTKLFLISTRAGSLGLNMVAANRVIILDTSWNPAHDIQSIFRVYRFGQKKDCYIYRLVALGTMEQKIYERSVTKQAVACRVVDEQQIDRHYNMQDLTELYRFDESGSGVESGVAAGVRDVALLRVARLRALHAVHEHDSLLRGSEPALPEHERQAAWSQFQQEHENGQLEANAIIKKISAVKRTYNKAAPAAAPKPEPGAPDDAQDFKPPPPKAKRGRKNTNVVENEGESILPDPDTDKITTLDPDTEHSMVKRITEILVRYNFSYKDAELALPQLVMNVRRIVMSGQSIARCDKLTAEIAAVLMQKQDNMSMPLVNGIIGESINQTMQDGATPSKRDEPPPLIPITAATTRGRPKKSKPPPGCRKGYVYEEIPSTSTAPPVPLFDRLLLPDDATIPKKGSRTKRKAALVAEKLLDTAVEDGVIDLDDDVDYDSSTDSAPETSKQDGNSPTKTKNKKPDAPTAPDVTVTVKTPFASKEPKTQKSKATKPIAQSELEVLEDVIDTSILLSDDDDGSLSQTAVELEPEGEISVHPSLLKNSNFIKIVAHTYLAGNPMLDEDAAMLAARYSTYKAEKELESTGKPITSGPIYDIAVQVLGKTILKKLHNTNHKMDTADDDTQSSLLLDLLSGSMGDKGNKDQPLTSKKTKATAKSKRAKKQSKTTEKVAKAPEPEKTRPKRYGRGRKIYIESDDDSDNPIVSDDLPLSQIRNTPTPSQAAETKSRKGNRVLPSNDREVTETSSSQTSMAQQPVPTQMYPAHAQGFPTPSQSQGVVPVGLFKTTVSLALPGEAQAASRDTAGECILPDDDDVHIVSDALPAPARQLQVKPPTVIPLSKLQSQLQPTAAPKRNPKPIVIKMVRSGNNPQMVEMVATSQSAPAPPAQYRVVTSESKMPILVPALASAACAPTMTDSTICLDSDEEDAPSAPDSVSQSTPFLVSQPAPYPVSQPTPYPVSQPTPYPVSQPTPYPVSQPTPYPVSQPTPYPVSQPTPYPVSQPTPYPVSQPTPNPVAQAAHYSTATSMSSNYTPKAHKQTTAAQPVTIRLGKVDPAKFVLTKKPQPTASSTLAPNIIQDTPVRYIVIPKSQVQQMYPPLIPLPADHTPPNPTVMIGPDGSYSYMLQKVNPDTASVQIQPTNANVSPENQLNENLFSPVTLQRPIPSSKTFSGPGKNTARNEIKTNTPANVPTIDIDAGRISGQRVEITAKKPTPVKPAVAERQTTPTKPAKPAIPVKPLASAKPATPATPLASAKPTTTAKPLASAKPATPAKPLDSAKSATPATPLASAKPTTTAKPLASAKPATPAMPVTAAKPVQRQRSISSSSDSDSDTNNDPLSILKDVVHIQADSYETSTPVKNPATKGREDKQMATSTKLLNKTAQKMDGRPSTTPASKSQPQKDSKKAPVATNSANKTRIFVDSVDLTFIDDDSDKTPTKASEPSSKPLSLTNKSQNTVTNTTNKTPSILKAPSTKSAQPTTKTSLNAAKTTTGSKTLQPTSSKNLTSSTQAAVKKRPAQADTAPPKKKKTDHFMTLKDFNLDDIDDIIELD